MAQHTPSTGSVIRVRRSGNTAAKIRGFPESTGCTFGVGDAVQLHYGEATSAHRVIQASSLSTLYLGIACDPASSVKDTTIPVATAHDNEFVGWIKLPIGSSLLTSNYYSLARDTTLGIDYIAPNSTAGELRVQITDINVEDIAGGPFQIGDTGGYVGFRFRPEFTQFGKST